MVPNAKFQFSIPSNLMPATKNNTGTWGVNTSDYIFPFWREFYNSGTIDASKNQFIVLVCYGYVAKQSIIGTLN